MAYYNGKNRKKKKKGRDKSKKNFFIKDKFKPVEKEEISVPVKNKIIYANRTTYIVQSGYANEEDRRPKIILHSDKVTSMVQLTSKNIIVLDSDELSQRVQSGVETEKVKSKKHKSNHIDDLIQFDLIPENKNFSKISKAIKKVKKLTKYNSFVENCKFIDGATSEISTDDLDFNNFDYVDGISEDNLNKSIYICGVDGCSEENLKELLKEGPFEDHSRFDYIDDIVVDMQFIKRFDRKYTISRKDRLLSSYYKGSIEHKLNSAIKIDVKSIRSDNERYLIDLKGELFMFYLLPKELLEAR